MAARTRLDALRRPAAAVDLVLAAREVARHMTLRPNTLRAATSKAPFLQQYSNLSVHPLGLYSASESIYSDSADSPDGGPTPRLT
jgi:hypothetical protein